MGIKSKFIHLGNFQHLIGLVTPDLFDVFENGLKSWNADTKIPERIIAHNRQNPITTPAEFAKDFVGITRNDNGFGAGFYVTPNGSHGKDTLMAFNMTPPDVEKETQIECSLRYLLKGAKSLAGKYTVYLHTIICPDQAFTYYGITRRPPYERMREHFAAAKSGSQLLFHRAIREYYPKARKMQHTIISSGLTEEMAYDAEEYLVDKYSLYPNHLTGLNMIPGGLEGIRQLHKLGVLAPRQEIEPDGRETALAQYLENHPRKGVPNPLISEKWQDDEFAEAVICGAENRLSAQQVRQIRALYAMGNNVEEILSMVGARTINQVQNVLKQRTYNRIR